MAEFKYVGTELELFAGAARWKRYVRRRIAPYLGAEVLEVGAGLGGSTRVLCGEAQRRWVGLEPDAGLAARLSDEVRSRRLPACCEVVVGTLDALPPGAAFDSVVYLDVLEHIEDDRGELARAGRLLRPGGHLIVLSPAHPWLFTPFDRAIGHHRRYTRASLGALQPPGFEPVRLDCLDSAGLLASLGNRLLLGQSMPTPRQIAFWDRILVCLSTRLDPLLGYRLGKSVLGIWRRREG